MNKQIITVDFTNAKNKKDIMFAFNEAFNLGYEPNDNANWDAFYDDIRSLNTQSPVIFKDMPKAVHVILKNPYKIKEISREDYCKMIEIMAEATDKKQRYDEIDFTFEISNDYE